MPPRFVQYIHREVMYMTTKKDFPMPELELAEVP
jgi:hypothetical protein